MRIGLPKGSVKHRSIGIIETIVGCRLAERQLRVASGGMEFFLLKHRDIPALVESGMLDFGITSSEWLEERASQLSVLLELDWCDTRISVIGPKHGRKPEAGAIGTCVTEFPEIAARMLPPLGLGALTLYTVSGSSEAMVPDLFNFGVDCVETGRTLVENDLVEFYNLLDSRVVAVCHKDNLTAGRAALKIIQTTGWV